jgi:hypothetical protein
MPFNPIINVVQSTDEDVGSHLNNYDQAAGERDDHGRVEGSRKRLARAVEEAGRCTPTVNQIGCPDSLAASAAGHKPTSLA